MKPNLMLRNRLARYQTKGSSVNVFTQALFPRFSMFLWPSPTSALPTLCWYFSPLVPGSPRNASKGQETRLIVAMLIHVIQQSFSTFLTAISCLPAASLLRSLSLPCRLDSVDGSHQPHWEGRNRYSYSSLSASALEPSFCSFWAIPSYPPPTHTYCHCSPTNTGSASPQTKHWPPGCLTTPSSSAQPSTLCNHNNYSYLFSLTYSFVPAFWLLSPSWHWNCSWLTSSLSNPELFSDLFQCCKNISKETEDRKDYFLADTMF